ncbi:MAG: hypothetical protein LBR66_08050, partial [Candidatus Symbiothrix sp.]|nr:hypothetical protein [Candidatus Symbiothrix sp.]
MKKELFFFAAAMLLPVKGIASVIDSITLSDTISLNEVEVVSVRAGAKTPVAHSELDQKTIESNNFGRDIPF